MTPLESYVVFAQVAARQSFTAAADALGISKGTASNHIARLEAALGVQLLHRTTRKMSLTEEGKVVFRRCQQIVQNMEGIEADLAHLLDEPRGRLRVNVPMTFGLMHLSPLVPVFCERYPHVEVDLQCDDRIVDLIEGGFDVGIRVVQALQQLSLKARKLTHSRRILCASPRYLERHGVPQTPHDLEQHACIHYTNLATGDVWVLESAEGEQSVRIHGPVRSNSSVVIKESVLHHQGIAQFPMFAVAKELEDGRLRRVLEEWSMPGVELYAIYPETAQVSPKVRAFIDFLVEQFIDVRW